MQHTASADVKEKILSLTIENAQSEQTDLKNSFSQMVTLYGSDDLGPIEKQSLAKYCFRYFSKDTAALISGDETIYSNISIDPQSLLPQSKLDSQKYCLSKVNGMNILIVGSKVDLMPYAIYTVQDITDTYTSISQLIWQFGLISIVCILIGITLIIVLLRLATKPLTELSRSVKGIAQGEYAERVHVSTKDEVGELALDFNSMAGAVQAHVEALKEITQRQQLFIGGLTHEFKTPLTSVIGHAETLLYTQMPAEIVENSLLYIHNQCRWLERLTQKLLMLITLQQRIQLKEESVEALLDTVRNSVTETLTKRGVLLEIKTDIPTLPMDFDLMLSLCINLVDNASKASCAGQTVSLLAHGSMIEVIDHGLGIPDEELPRITEPFYRVDKSRSKNWAVSALAWHW
jgi:signal transduction histidine kinase